MSFLLLGVGSAAQGTDPATDSDIVAIWDVDNAVTDAFGVNQITEPIGARHVVQATDAQKPALESGAVYADGTDDTMQGNGTWVNTVFPSAACTVVAAFRAPTAPSTNSPPATGYLNEMLIGGSSRLSLFTFTSAAKLGATIFTGAFEGVDADITLGAWYAAAVRWSAGNDIEISLDGVNWETASIGTPALTAVAMDLFLSFTATVYTEARMAYVAVMGAYKSNAEVQSMLTWLTDNKVVGGVVGLYSFRGIYPFDDALGPQPPVPNPTADTYLDVSGHDAHWATLEDSGGPLVRRTDEKMEGEAALEVGNGRTQLELWDGGVGHDPLWPGIDDSPFTIGFWYHPTASQTQRIVALYSVGGNPITYAITQIESGGNLSIFFAVIDGGGGTKFTSSTAGSIVLSAWRHVACRYNGANIQVFINGVASGSSTAVTSLTNNVTDPEPKTGWDVASNPQFIIDEAWYCAEAITDAHIAQIYSSGLYA